MLEFGDFVKEIDWIVVYHLFNIPMDSRKNHMSMVTAYHIEQFKRDGYFILESAIPPDMLELLREECMRYIAIADREMEAKGLQKSGINHYKKRYFVANRSVDSPIMTQFLYSELMVEITRATLGEQVYLFNEQYVVKAADTDTKFNWHQDSGYIGHYHAPYLSCWCALDDMTEENGTIYVLPYGRDGRNSADELIEHKMDDATNDKVGYTGDDPGDPALVPAGSIVVFSSRTFHRSGANQTDNYRRSYLAQYSAEPIMNKDNTSYQFRAECVVSDGQRVTPVPM